MNEKKTVEEQAVEDRAKAEWSLMSEEEKGEYAGRFELYAAYKRDVPGIKVRQETGGGCSREAFNPNEERA